MGKKKKKKNKQSRLGVDPTLFAVLNTIDLQTMFEEEQQEKWIPEEHTVVENWLYYRAQAIGR